MSDIDNPAIAAFTVMTDKGYTPEEIETFLEFLDQTVGRSTDHLEMLIYVGFVILAILIVFAPEMTRRFSNRFLGGRADS